MSKYYEVILQLDENKKAYVVTEDGQKIKITRKFLNKALPNDKVLIKIKEDRYGFVQKVLERSTKPIIGQIQINGPVVFVKPWLSEYGKDIFIDKSHTLTAKDGDVVEIQIIDWTKKAKSPSAKVVKVLYHATSEQYLLHKLNLPTKFPDDVLREVQGIELTTELTANRIDLRHLETMSIDPKGARDLDDALSIETTEQGYRVGIHIADVTAFIKSGTKLDHEAYNRGCSVYLPQSVIPMLPDKLSGDLCSLNENVDRLAVTVMVNFDKDWTMLDYYIFRSIIKNKKCFTYEEAEENKNNPSSKYYSELNLLALIGDKLRHEFFKDEISLTIPDINWEFDSDGNPIKIKVKKRISTNELIQSWMLVANKLVTHKIESLNKDIPWIYRVHGTIKEDNFDNLKLDLKNINIAWDETKTQHENLQFLLASKDANIVSDILVRKLRQAYYAPYRKGHFALGSFEYTHFTSPIRRYPDILVHRILLTALQDKPIICGDLEMDCRHLSDRERAAETCEKTAHELNILKFVKDLKYPLDAKIVNISKRGILVRTELMFEGFISGNDIKGDYNTQTRVWDNGQKYLIGSDIKVKIKYLDWDKREIVLSVV